MPSQVPAPPESPVLHLSSLLYSYLLESMSSAKAKGSLESWELLLCTELRILF